MEMARRSKDDPWKAEECLRIAQELLKEAMRQVALEDERGPRSARGPSRH